MIELDSISVAAGDFRLDNVSLSIPTGQYGILMGKAHEHVVAITGWDRLFQPNHSSRFATRIMSIRPNPQRSDLGCKQPVSFKRSR